MALSLKILYKSNIMKRIKGIITIIGATAFMAACNSDNKTGDYPAYSSGGSDTAITTNSTMDNSVMTPDTSVATTEPTTPATTAKPVVKKKSRIAVGTMPVNKNSKVEMDKTGVYEFAEVRPSYEGGQSALEDYLNDHTQYPQQAIDNNTQGTVNVQFTVDPNGKVSNAHVVGSKLGDGLDEEAVRVVSSLSEWTPGKVGGKTVKSKVTLPITFKIEE